MNSIDMETIIDRTLQIFLIFRNITYFGAFYWKRCCNPSPVVFAKH